VNLPCDQAMTYCHFRFLSGDWSSGGEVERSRLIVALAVAELVVAGVVAEAGLLAVAGVLTRAGVLVVAGLDAASSASSPSELSVEVVLSELMSCTNSARVGDTVGAPDRRLLATRSASSSAASSAVAGGAGTAWAGTTGAAVAGSTDGRTVEVVEAEAEEEAVDRDVEVEVEEFLVGPPPLGRPAVATRQNLNLNE
jgi:hypothetical protein